MSTIKQLLLAFVVACFLAAFAGGAVAGEPQANVKAGMALLKEKLAAYGKPHLEGTNLLFGEHKVNEDVAAVDAVKDALGVNATDGGLAGYSAEIGTFYWLNHPHRVASGNRCAMVYGRAVVRD